MAEEKKMTDELEKGPWPSYVKEIKRAAKRSPAAKDLVGVQELSFKDKVTHWKHGGIVGVTGYGGGVIGRYSDVPEQFPNVESFHTLRVNHPAGWFYTTKALRKICDIWEKVRDIAISPNHSSSIPGHTHNASMFPVGHLIVKR